jgi:hypothetical protein
MSDFSKVRMSTFIKDAYPTVKICAQYYFPISVVHREFQPTITLSYLHVDDGTDNLGYHTTVHGLGGGVRSHCGKTTMGIQD